jgi:hypothetical protein
MTDTLTKYASGSVAERDLTRLLLDPDATPEQLRVAERRAHGTPIGGHKMGDRVDALRAEVRARAEELEAK